MAFKSRSWGDILGLVALMALAGGADAGILWPRGKSTTASKAISDDVCLDIDNANPLPLRYGFPTWKTTENPNCATAYQVDADGQCVRSMSPENDCSAYCQQTNAWFYGEPIDAMDGRWCEVGQPCTKTVSISKTNGDSTVINSGESYSDNTVRTNSSESKDATSVSMGVSMEIGVTANPPVISPLSAKAGISAHHKWDATFSRSRTQAWSRTVTESKTYGVMNQTTFAVNIAESDSMTRPGWSSNYCGSWFAIPIVGISCGRGVKGRLALNKIQRQSACVLQDPNRDVFSHCFSYTFNDFREQDMTKYRMAFVLRDCHWGFILPGEWQPVSFQHSFSPEIYTRQHIERYGYSNLPSDWPEKVDDAKWVLDGLPAKFTKTLGPEDHTIKLCSPGGWCVRHKLTDNNCRMFFFSFSLPPLTLFLFVCVSLSRQ